MPELHLLTGAYALDALDDVERAGFERHLRSCGSCLAEVIEFQEAAAGLAERVATDPPDELRVRVLAQLGRTRQLSPSGRAPMHRPSLRQVLATAAAAVVIAGAAGLGGVTWRAHEAANDSRQAADRQAAQSAQLARIMISPDRIEVAGEPSIGGTATVVAAQGKAVFAAADLPVPAAGRAYQVWVIRSASDGVIRSAGLLPLSDGSGQSLVQGVARGDTVAVSDEPASGSKQPTTTPFLQIEVA